MEIHLTATTTTTNVAVGVVVTDLPESWTV